MRKIILFLSFMFLVTSAVNAVTLIWTDDFDGTALSQDWEPMIGDGTSYGLPAGWGNLELQYYTDRPENLYVSDGLLHIVAQDELYEGHDYTSARIRTRYEQDFLYGRLEASIKLPTGKGMWPAFWMMPTYDVYGTWAASGEIDIVEAFIDEDFPSRISGTIHYGGEWPDQVKTSFTYAEGQNPKKMTDFSQEFHVYAIEWEPEEIRFYYEGTLYGTATNWWSSGGAFPAPFDQYFHFLLNVAVGGEAVGPPDATTPFPQEMLVDYVRVYNLESVVCGDGTCDAGEDQCNCSDDCGTPAATETNCTDGFDDDCDTYTDCFDSDCDTDPACIGSYCGDGTCDEGENQCNCPDDCGTPPSTENCSDGIDNDCDTYVDCDDSDCSAVPACVSSYCGDGTCDQDEDQCNCSDDCGTPPSSEATCDDGIDEDCDGNTDCDDIDCDGDPACPDCGEKGDLCTSDADCCSNDCNTRKGTCK